MTTEALIAQGVDYAEQVQAAIDALVRMAEEAEHANQHALSSWFGSCCKWVRERARAKEGFTLTLPDPHGKDTLAVIEVFVAPSSPWPRQN